MRLPAPFLKLLRRLRQERPLPEATRIRRALRPVVVGLEPRFVLNATAELNAIGQLLIRGDSLADTVQLEVNAADQLLLRDASGSIIPIIGHPGSEFDPLDRSAITSGQLIVDLGGGDDTLNLEIPSGLNVTVLDGAGVDSTALVFQPSSDIVTNRTIDVSSDQIAIDSGTGVVDLRGTEARFSGNTMIGTDSNTTTVHLDDASLVVDGSLTLAGDVNLAGIGTSIDLSAATLSAPTVGNNLRISLAGAPGNDVFLGTANDSAGSLINDVIVDSASSLKLTAGSFQIAGRFEATGVQQTVQIDTDVVAGSVRVNAIGNVLIVGSVTALNGNLDISSNSSIDIDARLDTSAQSNGDVVVDGRFVRFSDSLVLTSSGRVTVTGSTLVSGQLQIDTAFRPATASGSDIVFNGTIDSDRSNPATLLFDARGANGNGAIILADAVGGLSPLDGMTLRAELVQIDSVILRSGDIVINAIGTTVSGTTITTTDDIEITGALTLPVGSLQISGKDVAVRGIVSGQVGSQSLQVTAANSVVFGNAIVDFADLTVISPGAVSFNGLVSLSGNLVVDSSVPTLITSSSIQTTGSQSFLGGVILLNSGLIRASQVNLGVTTVVAAGVNFTVNAPVVGGDLDKTGEGRLILTGNSLYTGETLVRQGILQVDGETANGAGPFRITGGRLEGSGRIRSDVITSNPLGTAPLPAISPGPGIDTLTISGLNLIATSTIELQIRGTIPGSEYDQLVVGNQGLAGTVQLGSSDLRLTFDAAAQPATEYVLVRNDGTGAVAGAFSTMFSTTGTLLASPRVLLEGSLVSQDFGGSGRPAFITYAGGDGNDVAIVTAGDVTIRANNVTLIQRNGSNLEIRTGNDLPSAQTATPTIRPIAAINDYQLNIIGSPSTQSLFVDLNRFVDSAPGAIQYTGDIVFSGGGSADNDTVTLFDLNTATDDAPASVRYSLDAANSGDIQVITSGNASQFDIRFTQTESIQQLVVAPTVYFQYSNFDEQITIAAALAAPERTNFTSTTTSDTLSISIENPTSQLTLNAGGGNDSITVAGFGSGGGGFTAALDIDGEDGADTVVVQAELALGRGVVTGNATINAESITINGDINTTGGTIDGQVNLIGGTSISISQAATINSGTASIVVDANGGTFNSVRGSLVSSSSSDAVVIANASRVQLGNVRAELGRLRIQTDALAGNVTQATGTRILVDRLSVDSLGTVNFSNADNEFEIVERIVAGDAVSISDSSGSLVVTLIDSQGSDVTLFTTGNLLLAAGAIKAVGATVNAFAASAILDTRRPDDAATANITAGTLIVSAGSPGIGTSTNPLVIEISESVTATTVSSDIFLSSPLVSMPIGLINAVLGNVTLDSVAIQDATDDNVVDIFANELRMTAQEGIGSVRKLELQFDTDLSATTNTGGIRLDNESNANPTIRLLKATSGPIEIQNSFSPGIIIQRIESGNGNVTVTNLDGSIVVRGDGVNADSIVASAGGAITLTAVGNNSDITLFDSIRTATGNIVLTADRNIIAMPEGDIQTAGGSVFVTADARIGAFGAFGAFGGKLQMSDGAVIDTSTGFIKLAADGDVTLGSIRSQNSADNAIVIESTSGKVTDGGDTDVDIVANSGGAIITALNGIGTTNAIETSLAVLVADTRGIGDLQVMESDAIDLRSVRTTDGSITVVAGGTITATKVISLNPNSTDNSPVASAADRDINLRANGIASDILVGQITAMNVTDVVLVAGDDVIDNNPADSSLIMADDLTVDAANGTSDGPVAVSLTTNVNDLVLSVTGINVGNVSINEVDAIELRSVTTADGSITIVAGGTITATKVISLNPNSIDNSPVASAPHRDISLRANGIASDILVGQITAMNVTDVVLLAGDDIIATNPADSSLIMADDLTVDAANGTSDGPTAVNLTTKVNALLLAVTGMNVGNVSINEVDAIELRSVTTADGSITIVAGGTITATKVISLNPNRVDNLTVAGAPQRDISLRANGIASDILVGQITAMNDADVLLVAGDDVNDTNPADSSLIMADDLTVEAANGTSDGPTAVNITTKVNDLVLSVTGINVGDVSINEVDAIELRSVTTADGSITVVARGTITATKVISLNPNSFDNSTVAGAPHRDISLRANGIASDILVGQITAMSITDVLLVAGDDVIDTNPADSSLIMADDLTVNAANGTSDGPLAVNLTTHVNDLVLSVTGINVGNVSINEVDAIELRSVTTTDGSITIVAGGTMTATQVISLNPNSTDNSPVASAADRDINLRANGIASDILVGQITAMNVTDVLLVAGDDVIDTNPADSSLIMADDLTVEAANGTSDGPVAVNLTTDVNDLVLSVTGMNVGDVSINDVDAIELRSVTTANGSIAVVAGGTITATKVISLNPASIDNSTVASAPQRDISLRANGIASDILVGQITAMNVTDVLLVAGDDVIDTNLADSSLIMADDLTVDAANGTSDGPTAVNLTTKVNDLVLSVTGINVGDVSINDVDAIELRSVTTANGSIAVVAGGTITATKVISLNPASIDNSTVASAPQRDISLRANGIASDILVGQITAMNVTDVSLVAGDDVIDTNLADSSLIMADDLTVDAANGTSDGPIAVSLTTKVNDIVMSVTGINVGDVSINEVDAIELRSVTTADGSITIVAGGTITATKVISLNPNRVGNLTVAGAPHRDITLRANGIASDILVGQITAMNVTDVSLVAGDDVIDTNLADSSLIMADDLTVNAANGTSDGPAAVNLTTKVNALVLSVTGINVGNVSINEVDAIELRSVTTADGSITIVAGGTITATKVISLNLNRVDNLTVAGAPHRDITLRANGIASDILVGQITAMNVTDVSLVAGDDVIDTIPADSSLIMADDLTVDAANGTSDGPTAVNITTKVNDLVLSVTGMNVGDVSINDVDAIELRSVTTANGSIAVVAGGTITATKVISLNPNRVDNLTVAGAPHRDISLSANGTASDILVGQITAMNVTDVVLVAGDDVIDTNPADSSLIMADDLTVDAANGTSDGLVAVNLTTDVNDLVLSVTGINVGNVSINEVDAIELRSVTTTDGSITVVAGGTITAMEVTASSPSSTDNSPSASRDIYLEAKGAQSDVIVGTLGSDSSFLLTVNGKILVVAGRNIIVSDNDAGNDGPKLRLDIEINAGGSHGQISLKANQKIELGGATQLEATSATKESIVIAATSVVLGSQIQLTTGNGIGIARWFSQRPAAGIPDTAFFDSTTVRKFPDNRLSGDGNSGGIGTFSVLIGQSGEAGFTIDIDWGANTNRFDQFNNLLGDKTFVTTHIYTGKDILNSTLNGRPSATDPLQVRFAVRHHESILVTGNSIQQAAATAEQVPGRLISSTDNPTTAVLESGTATFFIPNLTIPVAFFPVRQIIPEVVKPEIFVRVETSQFFASSTVESKTASASATVSREEYFQIRILSLEPGGEDLAAPQRLPDDILTGDKLKQLFAELPDGKYEIQYVLGDGNERMLLRVDIRNQQPVVPGDELDGGKLELQPIDPESILQELQEAIDEKEIQKPSVDAQIQAMETTPIVVVAPAASPAILPDDESEHDQHAAYALTGVIIAANVRKRSLRNVVANRPRRFSIAGRFVNRPK